MECDESLALIFPVEIETTHLSIYIYNSCVCVYRSSDVVCSFNWGVGLVVLKNHEVSTQRKLVKLFHLEKYWGRLIYVTGYIPNVC